MSIIIAGIDPALRNIGLVKGILELDNGHFEITQMTLIQPEASKNKQIRKNSDDLVRAQVALKGIREFLYDVDLVCIELPVGSQTARAMASYGISIGLAASITLPMIQLTATEVKLAGAGTKTASKQEMIDWATAEYPKASWKTKTQKGITTYTADNEHLADALAAIHAGVKSDEFKLLTALFRRP